MDRGEICDRFLDRLTFDLYPFQEEALLAWFDTDEGLLASAPTGMGKTLIAEAAVFEALATRRSLYYTTPLIALTDQKFREFRNKAEQWGFSRDDVGLITGNRRVNPDAPVRVVVAEILLNHLLGEPHMLHNVSAVVMDEFHNFNSPDRGIVWELSLVMLPRHVRLMLLSATVGNTVEFLGWLSEQHHRKLRLIRSEERRVPLEFIWVEDKLLTEHLPGMVVGDETARRAPALVFCFNRDECWEVAERLKGVKLIDPETRAAIEQRTPPDEFRDGVAPKLRQMLIRGVGVHHAGVLPRHKEKVEELFLEKLVPFVVCTETLAAGINLPARSVVVSTLMKGKRGEKKLIPASDAHQMFGRAGRPQFDSHGYVYALAHDDDVKIHKWRKRYEQIDPNSKDPGMMRMRKELERKKPSRRKTVQYWAEGQFRTLIKAGPAKLASRSMIPYQVLIFLLTRGGVSDVREFLSKRFNQPERLKKFQDQLDHMIDNLARFGFLSHCEDDDHVVLDESIHQLSIFRSVDPLYGAFLADLLARGSLREKVLALESVLPLPPSIERPLRIPFPMEPDDLQQREVEPALIKLGVVLAHPDGGIVAVDEDKGEDYWEEQQPWPLTFPEMLKALFDAKLATPEALFIQPKWVLEGIAEFDGDFFKFVRARNLVKNEGLILRHLLRLVILAGEFIERSSGDPDYQQIGERATDICKRVDPSYTDRFLASEQEARHLAQSAVLPQ